MAASTNLADYDSQAVREAAKRLNQCAARLAEGVQPKVKKIRDEIEENMIGEAADALKERMGELNSDVNNIIGILKGLNKTLTQYAEELERTARRLKQQMDS